MPGWLKIITIVLVLYAAVMSLWHPLVPGGLEVDVQQLHPGENKVVFTGYNTHFKQEEGSTQLFLSVGKTYFCASQLMVKDDSKVEAVFLLPDTLPSREISFYANNPVDGTVYVSGAIGLEGITMADGAAVSGCDPQVTTDEHSGFGHPFQLTIFETIRNLMWHVTMWFTMFVLMFFSVAYSLRVLRAGGQESGKAIDFDRFMLLDLKAESAAATGLLFCTLGLITGSIWARFTWDAWWTTDPQLNGAMAVFIVYVSYFILRRSIPDEQKRARISAIFNIFACVLMVILLLVMPRFAQSLHPGKGGNPAFSSYDLDSSLRMVFYPAVLGWILLGYWINTILLRIRKLEHKEHA